MLDQNSLDRVRSATINDFSNQWTKHGELDNSFWSEPEWLENICQGLFTLSSIRDTYVCEVGSGSGRILNMLNSFGPKKILAVEPSPYTEALGRNIATFEHKVEVQNVGGSEFEAKDLDYCFSIGVIHHIAEPHDVIANIHKSLKPDGKFIMWVYGKENNSAYLFFYHSISWLTKRMGDRWLNLLSHLLNVILIPYVYACKLFRFLPLASYINNVFGRCSLKARRYIIFDQLNPAYAKYYTESDCLSLLEDCGFTSIKIKHYNNYSWTAVAQK